MSDFETAIAWCREVFGGAEILSDHSKQHGEHESATCRLLTPAGYCFLKIHHSSDHWENEVYAYRHWAGAFRDFAPKLLAVRDREPLALVTSQLSGKILEGLNLPPDLESSIWKKAGAMLADLHKLDMGSHFGRCRIDGSPAEAFPAHAPDYLRMRIRKEIVRAVNGSYIDSSELATLEAAYQLIPAFEGERPTACHRDYCAANWLVDESGEWEGVIDFEFAYWDVRAVDFCRDPNWNWITRPEMMEAFFEGYGFVPSEPEEQQLFVARAEYALSAILWGRDNAFYGFEKEGHQALAHLAALLPTLS